MFNVFVPFRRTLSASLILLLAACSGGGGGSGGFSNDDGGSGTPTLPALTLANAFPNLVFNGPVDMQSPPGSNLLFVVERSGRIRVFNNSPTVTTAPVFLDISGGQVDDNGEGGLLGLAFHPDYAANGFFFVFYTPDNNGDGDNANRRVQVSRFTRSAVNPLQANPASEVPVITIAQPNNATNHNAGAIAFGPLDGYLYITLGDGGPGDDPNNHGQNRATLQGSIMRLDISVTVPGGPAANYAIPPDNPFAANVFGYREEIFAYGLRNPFRISFDQRNLSTQDLWAGDVGQGAREEVDLITSGSNYGWRIAEGSICRPPTTGCDMTGLTPPVFEYDRDLGRSITGGYVYRGSAIPELVGRYVFADFVSARVWALDYDPARSAPATADEVGQFAGRGIASLARDNAGEIYFLDLFSGEILELVPAP